jgi:hypothetical protein
MREVPRAIWAEVLDVTTQLTWCTEEADAERAAALFGELRAIYQRQLELGQSDPFLTEALADYTDDDLEAVHLYRLALAQGAARPDEPLHTKEISLGARLISLGDTQAARIALLRGKAEAQTRNDSHYVQYADELLAACPV